MSTHPLPPQTGVVETDLSLSEAREYVSELAWEGGTTCPCCDQFAKVYRRKLNAGMARSLIRMYRAGGLDWVDITRQIPARSREEGKLAYWRLVEPGEVRGVWRVTQEGYRFLRGAPVESHALVYNGELLRLDGGPITITEALGERFDLQELMSQ